MLSSSAKLSCIIVILAAVFLPASGSLAAADVPVISLVTDAKASAPAVHGAEKMLAALHGKGIAAQQTNALESANGQTLIIAGVIGKNSLAEQLLKAANHPLPEDPEGLVIARLDYHGHPAWVLAGSNDRGLMYAELDVADRIGWSADPVPLNELRETTEKAAIANRGVTLFTMNRAYWESRFYDEAYWARYLDNLARNRFNSIIVVLGYENGGFLAPAYPYFFDTEGFPDVRMVGISAQEQEKNLKALNRLVQMAHERGINFTIGIWDHIYRGNVQGGGVPNPNEPLTKPMPGLVWGMTAENLIPYTKAALTKFLQLVPNIDSVQFRMHDESGLKSSEQEGFWREMFQLMKQKAPNIRLDLRAKGLLDSTIQTCIDDGVNFRLTTKCWMEQMGLPFHPTHVNVRDQMNRRHGYADLLRYPQKYQMTWQLWNAGTARILLWGDPEFARRFCESAHLYDSDSFEIDEPLATKMEGQPHDMKPFDLLAAPYRYYDYEFERYWHYFQVFGRIGYNPNTPAETWEHEFQARFGKDAAPFIEEGLHKASWILPRIVASDYPYSGFPMTAGWAEKQHLGDLPAFAKAEGSDIAQFENFDEEAKRLIESGETAKMRPQETSRWFAQIAEDISTQIVGAEAHIGDHRNKEFDSTIIDLKILSNLALYHARRIPAAVNYRLYARTGDRRALDDAITAERSAIDAWRRLVDAAGDVYAPDLMMGARSRNLCGHWREELKSLEKGLVGLEKQQKSPATAPATQTAPRYAAVESDRTLPVVGHEPPKNAAAGKPLTITADITSPAGIKWVRLRYRSVNQYLDYKTLPMSPSTAQGRYEATIPGDQIVPTWDLMYYLEMMDNQGNGTIYPDFNKTAPYILVHLER